MARSVADATQLLETMATGPNPADPLKRYCTGQIPTKGYRQFLNPRGLQGARIGVLRTLSERNPAPQIRTLFAQAVADLRRAGASVVTVDILDFDRLSDNQWCSVFKHDINQYLAKLIPQAPERNIEEILASGKHAAYIRENYTAGSTTAACLALQWQAAVKLTPIHAALPFATLSRLQWTASGLVR